MVEEVDLDLMPWAPRSFKIRGATGEIYRVEEWLPVRVMMRISQLTAEQVVMLKEVEEADLYDASARLESIAGLHESIQKIVLVVLRHQYKDLTLETVQQDFPREASLQFLDFLFERFWFERFKASNPMPSQMPGTEETPKPKRSGRKSPIAMRPTGS